MLKLSPDTSSALTDNSESNESTWLSKPRLLSCTVPNNALPASPRTLLVVESDGWGWLIIKANDSPDTPNLRLYVSRGRHQTAFQVSRAQSYTVSFTNYRGKDSASIRVPQTEHGLIREAFKTPTPRRINTKFVVPAQKLNESKIKLRLQRSRIASAVKNITVSIQNLNVNSIRLPKFSVAIPPFKPSACQIHPTLLKKGLRPVLPKSMIEIRDSDLHHS